MSLLRMSKGGKERRKETPLPHIMKFNDYPSLPIKKQKYPLFTKFFLLFGIMSSVKSDPTRYFATDLLFLFTLKVEWVDFTKKEKNNRLGKRMVEDQISH